MEEAGRLATGASHSETSGTERTPKGRNGAPSAPLHAPQKCPHCHGKLEQLTLRGGRTVERCTTCGRDTGSTPRVVDIAPGPPPRPCRVDGCPGKLEALGTCPCCEKRATWAADHAVKRTCEICGGEFRPRGRQKLCDACAPVKQAAQTTA